MHPSAYLKPNCLAARKISGVVRIRSKQNLKSRILGSRPYLLWVERERDREYNSKIYMYCTREFYQIRHWIVWLNDNKMVVCSESIISF